MITFSGFVQHWTDNKRHMPAAEAQAIRRVALARVQERQAAGYGRTPLAFDDLCERIERALSR